MGQGGARFGAGRPAYRAKGEQLQRVDVRIWARQGYLSRARVFVDMEQGRGAYGQHRGDCGAAKRRAVGLQRNNQRREANH
jgi:hypothetical protein